MNINIWTAKTAATACTGPAGHGLQLVRVGECVDLTGA